MSALDNIIGRLDRVRPVGTDRYQGACPVCKSRKGSPLAVGINRDGAVLIHAFCGCSTESVLSALGLTLSDLYDKPLGHHIAPRPNRFSARELLEVVEFEISAAAIILADVAEGRSISELAWQRVALAAARIGQARVQCGH